jgi:hypothetical protein
MWTVAEDEIASSSGIHQRVPNHPDNHGKNVRAASYRNPRAGTCSSERAWWASWSFAL